MFSCPLAACFDSHLANDAAAWEPWEDGGFPSIRRLGSPPQPFYISASAWASVLGVKNSQGWECKDMLSFSAMERGFCYRISKGAAGRQV